MTAETEEVAEDFVDTSNVPPTLLVEVWTGGESPSRAITVPPALVAEVLT